MRSNKPKTSDGRDNGEKKSRQEDNDSAVAVNEEVDRCPICLNLLLQQELALPENCCHVFCLSCILKWAETVTSCPIDRKPFQAIYKQDRVLGCMKIPVKKKVNKTELQECSCNKEKEKRKGCLSYCNGTSRGKYSRRPLCPKSCLEDYERKCTYKSYVCCKNQKDSTTAARKNKVSRRTCSQQPVTDFSCISPSNGQTSGTSVANQENCAEFIVEDEPHFRQKRCRLEAQMFPWLAVSTSLTAAGLVRQSFDSCEVLNGVFALRSLLPDATSAANPFAGQFVIGKECVVTCSKGGEKKNTSRASGTKGSKNKAENATNRRRSARNSQTEESPPTQNPNSPQSNHSDSDTSLTNSPAKVTGASKKPEKQTVKKRTEQGAKEERPTKRKTRVATNSKKHCSNSPEESENEEEHMAEEESSEEKGAAELSKVSLTDKELNATAESSNSSRHSEENSPETSMEPINRNDRMEDSSTDETEKNNLPFSPEEAEEDPEAKPFSKKLPPLLPDEDELEDSEDKGPVEKEDSASCCSERALSPKEEDLRSLEAKSPIGKANSDCSEPPSPPSEEDMELEAKSPLEKADSVSQSSEQPYSPADEIGNLDAKSVNEDNESETEERTTKKQKESEDQKPRSYPRDPEELHDSETEYSIDCRSKADEPGEPTNLEESVLQVKTLEEKDPAHADSKETESPESGENKTREYFSEDNTEMVSMECDSPSRDHELKTEQRGGVENTNSVTIKPYTVNQMAKNNTMDEKSEEKTSEITTEQRETEKRENRQRRSRFHSPSTTWSPKRQGKRERRRSRSRSRGRDSPSASRRRSRSRSRDRESDKDGQKNDGSRRERSRERGERRGRRHSRSRSRTRGRVSSSDRAERGGHSPRRRDRGSNDNWRNSRGNDRHRRNDQDWQSDLFGKETSESDNGGTEIPSERSRTENPDWVKEKIKADLDTSNDSRWEEHKNNGPRGDSWTRNISPSWKSDCGSGSSRGGYRGGFGQGDQSENRWQSRNSLSGTPNNSGNDSYSRFNENRLNRRKGEQDFTTEPPVDRSGWSSASSWAVRRTLPADVQNYYSRRGRNLSGSQGGWMKPEEETPVQDPNFSEQTSQPSDGQQLPVNVMHHQLNVIPQPMTILPYPVGVHPSTLNMQPNPFNMAHQLPVHIHSGGPLLQVAAPATQGLPPPPPPPPPSQQANFMASQTDGKQPQVVTSAQGGNTFSAPLLPAPSKAPGSAVQGAANVILSSSRTQASTAGKPFMSKETVTIEANADSSKKEKKCQIQEKAVQEVKLAIKPYYQNKDITKDEYKEIVRKAVEKVCQSKSGEVNSGKVANLVKAYVDKYKHARKNKAEDHGKC
ncbi:protein SCAF11-like isoform X2 [Polyodon spathula]|uniref:protein SCAF11-like isoform X2 n=1 Tax=Polyodon spathula TaxID=7913 RepID=UPI001B7E0343|nr:protein SCAF11-like isoform X2 [Polyodon spathula]